MENKNFTLDEMMFNEPRYKNSFDMTSGRLVHVGDDEPGVAHITPVEPVNTTTGNIHGTYTNSMPKEVKPIQVGSVQGLDAMKSVDAFDILPKREKPNNDGMTDDQLSELDAAVDRECESITKRHDELFKMQEQEMEEAERNAEEKEMEEIDNMALGINNDTSTYTASKTMDYGVDVAHDDVKVTNVTPNMIDADDTFVDIPNYNGDSDTAAVHAVINDTKQDDHNVTVDTQQAGAAIDDSGPSIYAMDEAPAEEEVPAHSDEIDMSVKPVSVNIIDGVDNESLFDDDETPVEEDEAPSNEDLIEDLKNQVKEKIGPIKKTLDLSKFTIKQKAASAQKVMKMVVTKNQNVADWVLPAANRMISMTGLSGPEILKLNPENSNRNKMNTFRDMYQVMYNHLYDANKPEFEVWLKQLRFADLQHVYFALYMATFGGSNFINHSCNNPKCKKVFITDVDFKDMVVYANDDVKKKVMSIMKGDSTSASNDSYEATLIQVSDTYAFAIKSPSVWNVIMETATLSDQFIEKYADLIDVITYIDAAYLIDAEHNELTPIDMKPDANDMAKSTARRIAIMHSIISNLSSEEYFNLRAAINSLDSNVDDITYQVPKCTCPNCKSEIPAIASSPSELLFTRHQLAAFGSM